CPLASLFSDTTLFRSIKIDLFSAPSDSVISCSGCSTDVFLTSTSRDELVFESALFLSTFCIRSPDNKVSPAIDKNTTASTAGYRSEEHTSELQSRFDI